MIKVLIHGNDQVRSRALYFAQLKNAKTRTETIRLNGEKITVTDLIQALESNSLWQTPKAIFIENLFSRPKSSEQKKLHNYIFEYKEKKPDLILWEKKEITSSVIKKLVDWQISYCKVPASVFALLDNFVPNSTKKTLTLLHQTQQSTAMELIYFLLVRRVRELIIIKDLGKESLKGAGWQLNKIWLQAKKWDIKELFQIYDRFLAAEYMIKQGKSPYDLAYHLDLLAANL